MQWFINLILTSGESVVNIMLYNFLPVMVIMSGLMTLLDYLGVIKLLQVVLTPIFKKVGIPGLGIIAAIQISFISFAAPLPTFGIMEKDNSISYRSLSATLALIFTLAQANVTYLMTTYGLEIGVIIAGSILGGLSAATLTWNIFGRKLSSAENKPGIQEVSTKEKHTSALDAITSGGKIGMVMVAKAFPMLLIALVVVNILRDIRFIDLLNKLLSPLIGDNGSPIILAGITKYVAGGTAMLGVTINLIENNLISIIQLNKIAGFLINPMDIAGVAVYASVGSRFQKIIGVSILGGFCGIIIRGIFNLFWFTFFNG